MKLLTPLATRNLKNDEITREVLRSQEMKEMADKLRKDLANAEADFHQTLARNRESWAIEEEEHSKRVVEMKKEIDALEAQKLNALIPIGILKNGVDDRMNDAVEYLASIRLREEHADQLTEILQDKLDTVGMKEQDLQLRGQQVRLAEEGIERQKQSTILGVKRLSAEIKSFADERDTALKEIQEKKTTLFLQERTLEAKSKTLQRTNKALDDMAVKLADDRLTLERAWKELQRKKLSP